MNRRTFLAGASALSLVPGPSLALAADETVKLRELYVPGGHFSDYARAREGTRVDVSGFMAPPLKADAQFFVLTKRPMAVCPFCETSADWPEDILAVYLKRTLDVVPFNVPIVARGRLEIGDYRDPDTGFLSRVRLSDASYDRV